MVQLILMRADVGSFNHQSTFKAGGWYYRQNEYSEFDINPVSDTVKTING